MGMFKWCSPSMIPRVHSSDHSATSKLHSFTTGSSSPVSRLAPQQPLQIEVLMRILSRPLGIPMELVLRSQTPVPQSRHPNTYQNPHKIKPDKGTSTSQTATTSTSSSATSTSTSSSLCRSFYQLDMLFDRTHSSHQTPDSFFKFSCFNSYILSPEVDNSQNCNSSSR